jgi:26S proteasome regulatory subunit N2
MVGLTSAAGIVGFLSEPDPALQSFALQRLNEEIDLLWPEVAGSVSQMYAGLALLGILCCSLVADY